MRAPGLLLLLLLLVLAQVGCVGEDPEPGGAPSGNTAPPGNTAAPQQAAPPNGGGGGGEDCGRVEVPGHEAVDIRAEGVPCATAREVATGAQGQGRAPYQAAGFACTPADAPEGDTTYACTGGEGRVTFLYGVR